MRMHYIQGAPDASGLQHAAVVLISKIRRLCELSLYY